MNEIEKNKFDDELIKILNSKKVKFEAELESLSEQSLGYPPEKVREAIKDIIRYK